MNVRTNTSQPRGPLIGRKNTTFDHTNPTDAPTVAHDEQTPSEPRPKYDAKDVSVGSTPRMALNAARIGVNSHVSSTSGSE